MTTQSAVRIIAVAAAVSFALTGCQLHGKPHVARQVARVQPSPAGAGSGATALAGASADSTALADVIAPGIVEPWGAQVDLSAREPGWIAGIVVREGEVVRAGQPLATLEDEAQRRAFDVARAELAEAQAALEKTERGATPEELRQAEAERDAAWARSDLARVTEDRTRRLLVSGVLAKAESDRATSDAAAMDALARRAEARLQELTRGARPEDRSAARARVAGARARMRLAQANLDRRSVAAPGAGTILLSRFHAGEFYSPDAGPLFVLGDLTRLQVRLEVDEIDATEVTVGAPCSLYSDGGVLLARGTVVREAPRMGRRTLPLESPTARADVRVREVFVQLPATAALIPGQRVWAHTPRTGRRIDT